MIFNLCWFYELRSRQQITCDKCKKTPLNKQIPVVGRWLKNDEFVALSTVTHTHKNTNTIHWMLFKSIIAIFEWHKTGIHFKWLIINWNSLFENVSLMNASAQVRFHNFFSNLISVHWHIKKVLSNLLQIELSTFNRKCAAKCWIISLLRSIYSHSHFNRLLFRSSFCLHKFARKPFYFLLIFHRDTDWFCYLFSFCYRLRLTSFRKLKLPMQVTPYDWFLIQVH